MLCMKLILLLFCSRWPAIIKLHPTPPVSYQLFAVIWLATICCFASNSWVKLLKRTPIFTLTFQVSTLDAYHFCRMTWKIHASNVTFLFDEIYYVCLIKLRINELSPRKFPISYPTPSATTLAPLPPSFALPPQLNPNTVTHPPHCLNNYLFLSISLLSWTLKYFQVFVTCHTVSTRCWQREAPEWKGRTASNLFCNSVTLRCVSQSRSIDSLNSSDLKFSNLVFDDSAHPQQHISPCYRPAHWLADYPMWLGDREFRPIRTRFTAAAD